MQSFVNIEEPIINDDIFSYLVKKETKLENIYPSAIYIKNAIGAIHGSYYIYFYSRKLNTCFINDLNFYGSAERISVTNIIEHLGGKLLPHIKQLQNPKDKFQIPKFVYFHNQGNGSSAIVRQKINLKPVLNKYKEVIGFGSPDWSVGNDVIVPDMEDVRGNRK